jgi:PBP1b-binding outer membrane lipoprotein LpoB
MKKILVLAITASLFLFSCSKEEAVIKKYYKTTVVQSGSIIDSESFV